MMPINEQLDFFNMPTGDKAPAARAENFVEWQPKAGSPQYMAAQELIRLIKYIDLNEWQKKVLWPHLRYMIEDRMPRITEEHLLDFELGYVVGTIEIEQLRSRTDCLDIISKYGIEYR